MRREGGWESTGFTVDKSVFRHGESVYLKLYTKIVSELVLALWIECPLAAMNTGFISKR